MLQKNVVGFVFLVEYKKNGFSFISLNLILFLKI